MSTLEHHKSDESELQQDYGGLRVVKPRAGSGASQGTKKPPLKAAKQRGWSVENTNEKIRPEDTPVRRKNFGSTIDLEWK